MKTAYRSGAFGTTKPEHRPRKQIISLAVAAVVAAGAVWAGYAGWAAFQGWNSPSCSWPLRIQDMIAMGGPSAWRVEIGTVINPG